MTTRLTFFALVASVLLLTTNGNADDPQAELTLQERKAQTEKRLLHTHMMRREAATKEFTARIAEYKTGRSPVNVLLQSNQRLLDASLATHTPNAAVEYDRRAAEIESLAEKNLELGAGTIQEFEQAKAARLDAWLRKLLLKSAAKSD